MEQIPIETLNEMMKWSKSWLEEADLQPAEQVPFFGQPELRKKIEVFFDNEHFPHTLMLGPPGIGKTHLGRWIAGERGVPFVERLAPIVPRDLPRQGIILLDELHRQKTPEPLFPTMDNVTVTLLGATTRPENLDPAFRSRFFLTLHLRPYSNEAMEEMLHHYTNNSIPEDTVKILAKASAGNPRQLQRLIMTGKTFGWETDPEDILATAQINADGLTDQHLSYLVELASMDRPVGLTQMASLLYSDEDSTREVERLLLHHDLVSLTSAGRKITNKGKAYADACGWTTRA